jgi:putative transposase
VQAVGNTRERAQFIEKGSQLSIRCQCRLLKIPRSVVYYELAGETEENLEIMATIDRLHMEDPSAGTRRMADYVERKTGKPTARNRIRRLMRKAGIEAVYPHKRTTIPGGPSGIFPYLLKGIEITRPNQVWAADITYIPMRRGFMYLFAIIDWHSRKVIAWELSNTLDVSFCLKCLHRAIMRYGPPEIINTDQGCHFTSEQWRKCVQTAGMRISMDGRGRWLDNVVIERFWRTIKYEDIYLKSYSNPLELEKGVGQFIMRYNTVRPHRSLSGATPEEVFTKQMERAA